MFGDSLRPTSVFQSREPNGFPVANIDILLGGGGSYNVAENNRALPTDRVYAQYNGFYNAINFPAAGTTGLQMYTVGVEKTLLDGLLSVDVRMPFNSGFDFQSNAIATDSGNIGNLSMFLKGLAYQDEDIALSGGLGIGLPTGSDVVSRFNQNQLTIRNEAVHLMPFVACLVTPNDDWFFQGFSQIDFAASGNDVVSSQTGRVGTYTEQNLLHFDSTVGRWLVRNQGYKYLSGIAAVLELHYVSTIQDTDRVQIQGGPLDTISNAANRVDLLNLTSGLHFQLTPKSNFRVGAVVPLRASPDRVFSSEIQLSFNRLF